MNVRRELIRSGLTRSVQRLDLLKHRLGYVPLTTATMLLASDYWAQMRNQGFPAAPDPALDGDVILAAQAVHLASQGRPVIVASENVTHLARLVTTRNWKDPAWP